MPILKAVDHIHVYVSDRLEAEKWYQQVLGCVDLSGLNFVLFERLSVQGVSSAV